VTADTRDAAPGTPPAVVLFDLDGTLIDSLSSMAEALVEALEARGRSVSVEAIVAGFGPRFEDVVVNLTGVPTPSSGSAR